MKDPAFAKFVVLVNGAVPLALLCWDALHHQLGANPTSFAIKTTGMLTLVFLMLSLSVTPIRLITGKNWLSHFRRTLGLYAFFYGVAHFCTYFVFDRGMSISGAVSDTFARRFIFFGMAALLMMLPLAVTSTNGMIKRLGGLRWKRLHRLAYVAAFAGVLHFYLLVKADIRQPVAFATVLVLLLGYRVANNYIPGLRAKRKPVAVVRP